MKYQKIVQKPYCCVGACLEMVLNRHRIENKGQEDIAYQLGLTLPEEQRGNFKKARFGDRPIAGYGTRIQEEKYSIHNFFWKNKLPLIETYYYITDDKEALEFFTKNRDNDILIIFHCGTLYHAPHADWGHMVLLEDIKDDKVTILDSSAKRDYETFSLKELLEAIQYHGKEKGAGFYLIERVEKE